MKKENETLHDREYEGAFAETLNWAENPAKENWLEIEKAKAYYLKNEEEKRQWLYKKSEKQSRDWAPEMRICGNWISPMPIF